MVAGDRIGQHMEFEERLGESLRPQSRRALAAIAETYRDGVALAHEATNHLDVQGAVPRTGVLFVVEARLEHGTVRRLDRHEAGTLGIVELRPALVGGEAKADLEAAGIIDAEPSRSIDQREGLPRSGLRRTIGRHRRGAGQSLRHRIWQRLPVRHRMMRCRRRHRAVNPVHGVTVACPSGEPCGFQ